MKLIRQGLNLPYLETISFTTVGGHNPILMPPCNRDMFFWFKMSSDGEVGGMHHVGTYDSKTCLFN